MQSHDHNALNVVRWLCSTGHTSGYGGAVSRHFGIPTRQQKREMPRLSRRFRLKKAYSGWLAEA
jgi:hypothetical protein